jgi:hypothetical protein
MLNLPLNYVKWMSSVKNKNGQILQIVSIKCYLYYFVKACGNGLISNYANWQIKKNVHLKISFIVQNITSIMSSMSSWQC